MMEVSWCCRNGNLCSLCVVHWTDLNLDAVCLFAMSEFAALWPSPPEYLCQYLRRHDSHEFLRVDFSSCPSGLDRNSVFSLLT